MISTRPALADSRRRRRTLRWVALGLVSLAAMLAVAIWLVSSGISVGASVADGMLSTTDAIPATGRPEPLAVANVDDVRIQLPIARRGVTAIGYYSRRDGALLALEPQGRRIDRSFGEPLFRRFLATEQPTGLSWIALHDRGEPNIAAIGAIPGSEVYAPVSGTVTAITDRVLDGRLYGSVVRIQPLGDAETVIVLANLEPDATLSVGDNVADGASLVGRVIDVAHVQRQPLARYTHDSGANLELSVRHIQPDAAI